MTVLSVPHPFLICTTQLIYDQFDDSGPKRTAETNDETAQMTKNDHTKLNKCKAKIKNATNNYNYCPT